MAEAKVDKCAHLGCECPVANGVQFCSDYCESVGDPHQLPANAGTGPALLRKWRGQRRELDSPMVLKRLRE
jgi:hypothetical protein